MIKGVKSLTNSELGVSAFEDSHLHYIPNFLCWRGRKSEDGREKQAGVEL